MQVVKIVVWQKATHGSAISRITPTTGLRAKHSMISSEVGQAVPDDL